MIVFFSFAERDSYKYFLFQRLADRKLKRKTEKKNKRMAV